MLVWDESGEMRNTFAVTGVDARRAGPCADESKRWPAVPVLSQALRGRQTLKGWT